MKTSTHKPAAFAIQLGLKPNASSVGPGHLLLRPTEDGWSLITAQGELVLRNMGIAGRHACLEFARDHGLVVVLSQGSFGEAEFR
jgi:hypothetical protein